jgi:hypothetical protein
MPVGRVLADADSAATVIPDDFLAASTALCAMPAAAKDCEAFSSLFLGRPNIATPSMPACSACLATLATASKGQRNRPGRLGISLGLRSLSSTMTGKNSFISRYKPPPHFLTITA